MRLIALTCLTMLAFAANSLLTRAALAGEGMDPGLFAVLRTLAGALTLAALVARRGGFTFGRVTWGGPVTLGLYMIGFSLAYRHLDTGIGALILFGGVQATMFAGAVWGRTAIPTARWVGAAMSIGGLALLVWPTGPVRLPLAGIGFMSAAAAGWGLYSLIGRGAQDPLQATAANFALAVPLVLPLVLLGVDATGPGIAMAMIAGAVTSGLGYALWYAILPRLAATQAALAQLSVPVLAASGGVLLLDETPTLRFLLASALVLGGIGIGLYRPKP